MSTNRSWLALALAVAVGACFVLGGSTASAQPEPPKNAEAERAAAGAAGDSPTASGPGTEHHSDGPSETDEGEEDPSRHFNFLGFEPGHVFDYRGKDEMGGTFGDGQMVDPVTGHVFHEEEPASPPFIFMLFNFAILLGLDRKSVV